MSDLEGFPIPRVAEWLVWVFLRSLTDQVVMSLGRIVEIGSTRDVLRLPQHCYTRALLSVVSVPNPRERRERVILQGETPNPINSPPGCRFHPRCPVALARCQEIDPPFVEVSSSHQAVCLLALIPPSSDSPPPAP